MPEMKSRSSGIKIAINDSEKRQGGALMRPGCVSRADARYGLRVGVAGMRIVIMAMARKCP